MAWLATKMRRAQPITLLPLAGEGQRMAWLATKNGRAQPITLLPLAGEGQPMAWLATKNGRAQPITLLPLAGEGGAQRRMRAAFHRTPSQGHRHQSTKTDRAATVQQRLA
ncbi:hypothetical protein XcuCFBP2542_00945 [Xanthomonas cucurbitae]|uniref:Uncharacterized protein n=1 Tax=Xanthomonas cucurbitae TaxID=56453 RepID=A0A2S7DYD5_9XANT|nr:hypothetical protein XcuCFBP2542_00945 [Xanthomonas cucurbitae]